MLWSLYPYWFRRLGLLTSGLLGLQNLSSGYSGHTDPASRMSLHGSEGIFEIFQPCPEPSFCRSLGSRRDPSAPVTSFSDLKGEHGCFFHPPITPPTLIHTHLTCRLWFRCETPQKDSHTGGLVPQQYSEVTSTGG